MGFLIDFAVSIIIVYLSSSFFCVYFMEKSSSLCHLLPDELPEKSTFSRINIPSNTIPAAIPGTSRLKLDAEQKHKKPA